MYHTVLFHFYCSKLDEDNLYMAYADIMAKVRLNKISKNTNLLYSYVEVVVVPKWPTSFTVFILHYQSCHDEEEEDGDEVKSFEVCCLFQFIILFF